MNNTKGLIRIETNIINNPVSQREWYVHRLVSDTPGVLPTRLLPDGRLVTIDYEGASLSKLRQIKAKLEREYEDYLDRR